MNILEFDDDDDEKEVFIRSTYFENDDVCPQQSKPEFL